MDDKELLLLGVAGLAFYFFVVKRPVPVVTTVQPPSVAPPGAYSPAYGFPTNTMNGSAYASGGYSQRDNTAQDVATYLGAIGGLASTVSNIASDWT